MMINDVNNVNNLLLRERGAITKARPPTILCMYVCMYNLLDLG